MRTFFSPSDMRGVGHPIKPVTDVRGTDARSRERDRPEGVTQGLQVSVYKVDPRVCVLARNLLSKNSCRAALCDEVLPVRPEVALVIKPSSRACRGERLARTGASPNRSVVTPSGKPKGVAPDTDAGEEVTLSESTQVAGVDILDAPFVHDARRYVAGADEFSQARSSLRIDLVVVGGHRMLRSWPRLDASCDLQTSTRSCAAICCH